MNNEVSQKPKKTRNISHQTAIVHIMISVMYFVDAVIIPIANTCSFIKITIVLGINALVVLLTGIIGFRASKRPSITLIKWYMSLSVLCGVGGLGLLVVAILRFISSCDPTAHLSGIFAIYSILSALFEIPNCIISVFIFHKGLNKLIQKKTITNVQVYKLEERAGDSKYEYNTITELNSQLYNEVDVENSQHINDNRNRPTEDEHLYQETLQGALEHTEGDFDSHHMYPTVIVTAQNSHQISPQCVHDETVYIEMDNKMTSHGECPRQNTMYVYDYTYAAPEPPPRPRRPSSLDQVPKSLTLPNSYLELYSKSDPPEKHTASMEQSHAKMHRHTYFHAKFASRFQALADDQPTSSILFPGKVHENYNNAFADRLKSVIYNEQLNQVAIQPSLGLDVEAEDKLREPFPRPKSTDTDQQLDSVERQSGLYDDVSIGLHEGTSSKNTEPGLKDDDNNYYDDCVVNHGGMVGRTVRKMLCGKTTGE